MKNIKTVTVLFGLFALFSVAYTVSAKEQKDDNKEVKSLMEELLKGVVVQMQEDDNQQSSVQLQSAMRDLLAEVQDDENESDGDLSALLQTEDDEGSEQEDDDGNIILALLQDEEEGDDGAVTQEDSDEADTQGWFKRIFRGIRRFGGRVRGICNKVNRYSRYLNCLPRMQAEMQKADDGDEELAKNLLKRIANAQEDDAEAQFFRRLFRKARKIWGRGRRFFKKIRRGVGRIYRGYRNIRKCIRRNG